MNQDKAKSLLKKYLRGECDDEEIKLLESWYNHQIQRESLSEDINYQSLEKHIWKKLDLGKNRKLKSSYLQWAAAALILFFSAISFYLFVGKNEKSESKLAIVPGGNIAKLSFSDGREINLDEISDGETVTLNNINIYKNRGGELVYKVIESDDANTMFSLLETPKGGQYQIELADGTKAWLNAASSIRFPSVFAKQERLVEITGEVYFEVAKDPKRPFKVKASEQFIEVLGTHFNVNAYHDEPSSVVTLLEGAIKISAFNQNVMLRPGEQIVLSEKQRKLEINKISSEDAIAWKSGYFHFSGESMGTIMRKIARWYDVDIEYHKDFVDQGFVGTISRFENISKVLRMLELTGTVHFEVKGRRIIVMP